VADIPAGAQRSDDGHYWWDEPNQAWQLVAGNDAGTPAAAAAPESAAAAPEAAAAPAGPPARTGSISIELGVIVEESHAHDDVVAMVERGGASLPQGEAYA
jgi:hypothetical protein